MKNLLFLLIIFIPISSSAQSENFKLNDCVSSFEISFYNRLEAGYAHDRHTNPKHDEIHIIFGDRNISFNGYSFSSLEKMLQRLSEYQQNRTYISDYNFTIGIHNAAHFYMLDQLLCGLSGISSEISSQNKAKLYLF